MPYHDGKALDPLLDRLLEECRVHAERQDDTVSFASELLLGLQQLTVGGPLGRTAVRGMGIPGKRTIEVRTTTG